MASGPPSHFEIHQPAYWGFWRRYCTANALVELVVLVRWIAEWVG
ncbi:hypothetical protein ACQ86N_27685 [Puia sp. P3]